MSYKIDFHTHSIVSHDGGILVSEYEHALAADKLNYVAVTDHNEIRGALNLKYRLGERIIVGEEIKTQGGEIIALYISESIPSGLSIAATITAIKEQGGLVYVPHPFERGRHGLSRVDMEQHKRNVDIIEVFNGRGWGRGRTSLAIKFAADNNIAMVSSSDAHGRSGLGRAYTIVLSPPTKDNLVAQLRQAGLVMKYSSLGAYVQPAVNRWRRRLNIGSHE